MRRFSACGLHLFALMFVGLAIGCKEEGPGTSGTDGPPNFLILVSDDQGVVLGCYGDEGVQTPRLDMLAQKGVRFTRAYAPSAVCTPSRSSLYTGLMPAHHGATGFQAVSEGVPVWGELLGEAGYRTGLIGKLGAKPIKRFPFDFVSRSKKDDETARDLAWHVDEFDRFIAEDDGRPWALIVNFRDSHWPFPEDGAPFGRQPPKPHDPASVTVPPTLVDTPLVRQEIARYYDGLRRMDATVGAIVDRLAARGLRRNTVGMFTSDNGPPFPFAKTTLYEAGIHMPLITFGRFCEVGATRDQLVSLVDILPTMLDLAEAEVNAEFDGASFAYFMEEKRINDELEKVEPEWRTSVFANHDAHRVEPDIPSRSVRFGEDARWKYIRTWSVGKRFENLVMKTSASWAELAAAAGSGRNAQAEALVQRFVERPVEELFDLSQDPNELVNLAGEASAAEALAEGRKLLEASSWLDMPAE